MQDTHLNATLRQIDELANDDIEMQAPPSRNSLFLVLDTNILLHYFEPITQFVEDVERLSVPILIIIPGIVVHELDGQKQRPELGWFSRRASTWLLKKIKERKSIKGQANEETCSPSGSWKIRQPGEVLGKERLNDSLVLDCCKHFQKGGITYLCSADKNLCIEAYSDSWNIPAITPENNWGSRDIARALGGDENILRNFQGNRSRYRDPKDVVKKRSSSLTRGKAPTPNNTVADDKMDIDDVEENLLPSHALDLLHLQVIEHFTSLLIELVARVGGTEVIMPGLDPVSRYAPGWKQLKKPCHQWVASPCLEYLGERKKTPNTRPSIGLFLSRPYSCQGARRGQDWSRRDWDICIAGLVQVGEDWKEPSFKESARELEPHMMVIFSSQMRPTGS
ncbi:hypothetical protein BDN72DRAFT_809450 [Pluteus cervinus]|uniref:Uncharacterized protein n=1 Tax=Pluteus cervinus TaxID=181527 RepID=A0ACD3BCC2_9AGAR|nr:hypothetical protein BDN72DRAFT_809450 [Pluteus cervinus]